MRSPILAGALTALGVVATAPASAACLRYEPAQVVLSGRLVAADDGALRLRLDRPICTLAGSDAAARDHVRVVRLVFGRAAPVARGLEGRRAAVSGSLFHNAHDGEDELRLLVSGLGRAR